MNKYAPRYTGPRRRAGTRGERLGKCFNTSTRSPRVGPIFQGAVSRGGLGDNRQSLRERVGAPLSLRERVRVRDRYHPAHASTARTAAVILPSSGRTKLSSGGLKGMGTSSAVTRLSG